MNDQQRAAIEQALGAFEVMGYRESYAAIGLREALAQSQGEPVAYKVTAAKRVSDGVQVVFDADELLYSKPNSWVDLTPQDVYDLIREGAADGGWQGFAQRVTSKFKEKQCGLNQER